MYNVVTRPSIILELKKSKYYKQSLGLVPTVEKNGSRVFNDKDTFSHFYNTQYNTNILRQGTIGDITFYIDYYINEDLVALYLNTEEFIYNYEPNVVKKKGIDFYLGSLFKRLENENEDRVKEAEGKKIEIKKDANPDIILSNPGNVTYDDLKAYLAKKSQNRMSS
jgi:hypothetical protein